MKSLITLILTLLLATLGFAQNGINYKAIIKDNSGNVIANDLISVQFTILQGVDQTNVYQETHTPTTDANGLIIVNVGEGTLISGTFATIDWASYTTFLNTKINTGSGLVDMGTTEFKTVPYALHAKSVTGAVTKINDLLDGKSDANGSSLFIGQNAGAFDDGTLNGNVGIGLYSLLSNTTGNSNTAIGSYSLQSNTTGSGNTANGFYSLHSSATGSFNTAIGFYALSSNTTGSSNTANGYQSLSDNTTGFYNTANGFYSLSSNTTGNNNTANGLYSLFDNTIGNNTTSYGSRSLSDNTTGSSNTAIGYNSLNSNTTGNDNVIIGANAGALVTTGSGNVIIGTSAGNSQNYSNSLLIDNSETSSPLIYGDFQNNKLFVNRNYGISNQETFGVTTEVTAGNPYGGMYVETKGSSTSRPFYGFAIDGSPKAWIEFSGTTDDIVLHNSSGNFMVQYNTASKPVAGSWIANSDKRLKKNIIPLDKEQMLQKIVKMKGVSYEWNDTVTDFERPTGTQIGFIAQDLQKIWPEKVSKDHLGYLQTAYGDYDPVIIEAIKALNEKIERQEREINGLKKKVSAMEVNKNQSAELESQ